jgi:hypothetical protein
MAMPRITVSCFLIVGEFHLDLIFELDVTLVNLVIHLAQFLEKAAIGGGTDDFGFDCRLLSPQTLEPQLNALSGCLYSLRMPNKDCLQIGWL